MTQIEQYAVQGSRCPGNTTSVVAHILTHALITAPLTTPLTTVADAVSELATKDNRRCAAAKGRSQCASKRHRPKDPRHITTAAAAKGRSQCASKRQLPKDPSHITTALLQEEILET